jgi:hypothetical protein
MSIRKVLTASERARRIARLRRREAVFEAAVEKKTFREIASKLGCSAATAFRDYHAAEKLAWARLARRGVAAKSAQFHLIESMIRDLLTEWRRGLEPRRRVRTNDDGSQVQEAVEGMGNPALYALILQCLKAERELMGWDVAAAENIACDYTSEIARLERQVKLEALAMEQESSPPEKTDGGETAKTDG